MGIISNLAVYENTAPLGGRTRVLRWNNLAIINAARFAKTENENTILQSIASGNILAIRAVVYGARKAVQKNYTKEQFNKDFSLSELSKYIEAVTDGITHFLPECRAENAGESGNGKSEADMLGDYVELARKALNFSLAEILKTSPRIVAAMMRLQFGEEFTPIDEYYGDEIPWL